jgi:glycosyltransferase involved in cell wall biosynthesis
MSVPHVLIVVGSLSRGGSEAEIVKLVRASHPGRARCTVVCLSRRDGAFEAEVRAAGVRILKVGFVGSSWKSLPAILRLARFLQTERPDVVYAFNFWSYVLAFPVAAVCARGATRVVALRSAPDVDLPHRRALLPLRHLAFALAHGAIANAAVDVWSRSYPRVANKIVYVPNGVPPQALAESSAPRERGRIVCVANLRAVKGHTTLLEAVALLPDNLEWTLQLAGDGAERRTLERKVIELGIAERVEFLGSVDYVERLLSRAELAVLASYSEGLPNAVLEAMSRGVPVVATNVGQLPEVLGTGAGTLVPPRDAAALAEAIRLYLEQPARREQAGSIGRREVANKYSVEANRDRTLAALESFGRRGA